MIQKNKIHPQTQPDDVKVAPNKAVISIGSNIEPEKNVREALFQIGLSHEVIAQSRCRWTRPIGFTDQPDFLNCVMCFFTSMSRRELMQWLKMLENQMGRIRTKNKYGPRTIDLDIVIWNGKVIDSDVYERKYLKESILEIWPGFFA